jgi:hypothetical protein
MKLFPSLRVLDALLRHGMTRAKIEVFGHSEGVRSTLESTAAPI